MTLTKTQLDSIHFFDVTQQLLYTLSFSNFVSYVSSTKGPFTRCGCCCGCGCDIFSETNRLHCNKLSPSQGDSQNGVLKPFCVAMIVASCKSMAAAATPCARTFNQLRSFSAFKMYVLIQNLGL